MKSENSTQTDNCFQPPVSLQTTPLSATFGAIVSGLDFSKDISGGVKKALKQALLKYQVLLFRQQCLNEEQQIQFAQIFGPCRVVWQSQHYPSSNELTHYLSNVDLNGLPVGHHPDLDSTYWHSDGSWSRHPARATALNAIQVPEADGLTHFANMYRVYDDLDQPSKDRLMKLKAEHHVEISRAARYRRLPWQWLHAESDRESLLAQLKWWSKVITRRWRDGAVYHPVVRPHPETGRPALFIGDHAWRVSGKFWPVGVKLMKEINALRFDPAAIYTHRWQPGDLLIWDNGSILHRVGTYSLFDQVRIMRRCVVMS